MAIPARHAVVSGTYFVTSRTWEGRCLFITENVCQTFVETLYSYRSKGAYLLHSFVLMPDHFHVLLTPAPDKALERVVQLIKGGSARSLGLQLQLRFPVWQRGFSDHRIRDARDLDAHVFYIEENPVRKRLVISVREFRWSSATGGFQLDDVPLGLKPQTFVATVSGTAKAVP